MRALSVAGGRVEIVVGDCRDSMRAMPACSVHTCVTSPPYFGLRDYGVDGQIGLEGSRDAFLVALLEVFREVRRVLRDDGTLWVNMGDSYAGSWGAQGHRESNTNQSRSRRNQIQNHPKRASKTGSVAGTGCKPKDLMGIPWRLAFALQDDGWYLRQDIIWSKPSPMPESVTDRCTKAHEYLFLLSKQRRYYWDRNAMQESADCPEGPRNTGPYVVAGEREGCNANIGGSVHKIGPRPTRNKRSVWTVSSQPFREAHFATYPPKLIEPCILAGCPKGGVVLDPFGGAGTTGLVAARHGRQALLCELNPEYAALAQRRIADEWREQLPPSEPIDFGPLFGAQA